ncbi:Intracellular ribonuclease LX [Linum perenne]
MMMLPELGWSYDYHVFALQLWPTCVCHQRHCALRSRTRHVLATFKIHGLWPINWGSSPIAPVSCTLDQNNLKTNMTTSGFPHALQTAMDTHWPDQFRQSTNWKFWSHEWDKHGLYTSLLPVAYFQDTIAAYSRYNPLASLRRAGIVPDNSRTYNTRDFQLGLGGNPSLKCYLNPLANNYILLEINPCFDTTSPPGMTACHPSVISTCGGITGNVKFLHP